ncbi:MAG TPA: peptide-methionine (S)-S-oxide reductase [Chloroflexi bacterium]|nr:peptide-methionine (S)-S-oxide reductase [Chloroflexota bacterium]
MVRTRVGYAGGTTEHPTYYNLGDHTETIQVEYDPTRISYQELLDVFWAGHDPARPAWSRQYASIIFYHDEEQQRLARASKEQYATRGDRRVYTEIVPAATFYLAEDYHQKYRLRLSPIFIDEFTAIYPEPADLVNSTATARVNGYLGGHGTLTDLQAEIDDLGLSPNAQEELLRIVLNRSN